MNFIKKLIAGYEQKCSNKQEPEPQNTKLNYLLDTSSEHRTDENYKAVLQELSNGNSYLLIPSVNDTPGFSEWKTLKKGSILCLTSVSNVNGLQVLGAFSDQKSLYHWAKGEASYVAMRSQHLLEFCHQHGVDRIVINSDQKNMFVLERSRANITTQPIKADTEVIIGRPAAPLNGRILKNLITNLHKIDTIEEAYQYAQSYNGETKLVLGIYMSNITENSRAALHHVLNKMLQQEQIDVELGIMIIQTEEWLQSIRNVQNSLLYKRNKRTCLQA